MIIERIDYLNKEADLKPTCYRCGYSMTPVWVIKDIDGESEEVCENCLSKEEFKFNCENARNLTEEESEAYARTLDKMSEPTGIKLFD